MTTVDDVLAGRSRWCVVEGDAADVLCSLPASSTGAVVTDPPSGIAFMNAEWDRDKGGRAAWVAWLAEILGLARAACVPGARAAVWALPRTSHWTGCAVEDAGWSIETKGVHLFGTGWPKGKSQLKPACEDWWIARTGPSLALNVDACRVGTSKDVPTSPRVTGHSGFLGTLSRDVRDTDGFNPNVGRYPPNVLLSHSPGCVHQGTREVASASSCATRGAGGQHGAYGAIGEQRGEFGYAVDGKEIVDAWACVEGCPVRELDAQAGPRPGLRAGSTLRPGATSGAGLGYGSTSATQEVTTGHDTGGEVNASRFFPQFQHGPDEVPFLYCAKPSRAEKEEGCADVPRVVLERYGEMGRGPLPKQTPRVASARGNSHPTVKPVDLMRWLVRLISQPGDVVLDPFGGSGTTGVAALREGRRVILVERDSAFAAICRARLEHAHPSPERRAVMASEPVRIASPDFGPLFGGKP